VKSIAVFCASGSGKTSEYAENAYEVGKYLANLGVRVVYGGSRLGLMGALADGALEAGGKVIGVLPEFMLPYESAHQNLSELIIVDSMQQRKLKMHEMSDGIITLPGGFGTFEELFEILTWAQLGLHQKPVGLLNHMNYFHYLIQMIDHMVKEGMLRKENAARLLIDNKVENLLKKMKEFISPVTRIEMRPNQA